MTAAVSSASRGLAQRIRSSTRRAARSVLERNPRLFLYLYDRKARRPAARPGSRRRAKETAAGLDDATERQLNEVLAALRRDGIARWPGLYADAPFLEQARREVRAAIDSGNHAFDEHVPTLQSFVDESTGWRHDRKHETGRARVTVFERQDVAKPDVVRTVMADARLKELASRYYDHEAWPNYILMERLRPAVEGDFWHFDKIYDQVKAMILLTDVGPENGPIRVKPATHHRPRELDPFFCHTFNWGVSYAYPPEPLVRDLTAETIYGHGRAGDCFLLDTLAVHSGTRCRCGERLMLVSSFNVNTPKNAFLWNLERL